MTKRAVIYCRVSTDEAAKDGHYGLSSQLDACRKYAADNGFEVVKDFSDDYTGTVVIQERPEGRKAYAMLARGEADALIIHRMSRLIRPKNPNQDAWDVITFLKEFITLNCELHSALKGLYRTDFFSMFLAANDAREAGEERKQIVESLMRGKRQKAKHTWVGNGNPPFGYTKVGKLKDTQLVINPDEADLVRRMFNLYLGRNGEPQKGLFSIADTFNTEGIPTTGRYRKKNYDPAIHQWRPSTLSGIIANPVYIGEFSWGGEVVTIPTLAIIDVETFEAAQAQRGINRVKAKRNVKHDYLLRGRMACTCGNKMSCINYPKGGKVYLYYRCSRRPQYEPMLNCDNRQRSSDLVDRIAWNWLVDVFRNPEKLLAGLYEYQARQRDKAEPNRKRLAELPGLIAECEAQARRLTRSLENVPEDDELGAKTLEERLGQISAAHKRYTAERDRITAELAAMEVSEADIQEILTWAAVVRAAIDKDAISFEARRLMFERLDVMAQIEYRNGERGLRLKCPVLAYASKWQALSAIDNDSLKTIGNARSGRYSTASARWAG
jgi:DNA invertase Pin-like site-specific DNA recombinase